jgi:hypothetical protein
MQHVTFVKMLVLKWAANGGNKCYTDMAELKADYSSGALHPGDCYVT